MSKKERRQRAEAKTSFQQAVQWEAETQKAQLQIGTIVGFVVLAVYWITLCPTVGAGDSGEISTVSYSLGVAHPPGYPLLTMLGKLFTYLPFGSVAYRVNLLSAVCGAGAALFIFRAAAAWTRNLAMGVLAAGVYAFSVLPWSYSVVAEVFALNNFFVAALLDHMIRTFRLAQRGQMDLVRTYVIRTAVIFGLAAANHHTIIFLGFPIFFAYLITRLPPLNRPSHIPAVFGLGMIGLPLYAIYLPWASAQLPPMTWGFIQDWRDLLTHFMRAEYGTFQLLAEGQKSNLFTNLSFYLNAALREFQFIGAMIAAGGLYLSWKRAKEKDEIRIIATMTTSYVLYLVVFLSLSNIPPQDPLLQGVLARFYMLPNIFASLWLAYGVNALLPYLPRLQPEPTPAPNSADTAPSTDGAKSWLDRVELKPAWLIALVAVALQLSINFKKADHSENRVIEQFGKALLGPLPQNALLLVSNDPAYTATRYLQVCENYRTDVQVLNISLMTYWWTKPWAQKFLPEVIIPGNNYHIGKEEGMVFNTNDRVHYSLPGYSMAQFLRENMKKHQLYINHKFRDEDLPSLRKEFQTVPMGLADRIYFTPELNQSDLPKFYQTAMENLRLFPMPPIERYGPESWEHYIGMIAQYCGARIAMMNQVQPPTPVPAPNTGTHAPASTSSSASTAASR